MPIFVDVLAKSSIDLTRSGTWRIELPTDLEDKFFEQLISRITEVAKERGVRAKAVGYLGPGKGNSAVGIVNQEAELVNFRAEGASDKTILVYKGLAQIESIVTASEALISAEFPRNPSQAFNLETLAKQSAIELISLNDSSDEVQDLSTRLGHAMGLLQSLLEINAIDGRMSWNVEFLHSVGQALERLSHLDPSTSIYDHVYRAFGLPDPSPDFLLISEDIDKAAKDLNKAYQSWWKSRFEIAKSIGFLHKRVDDSNKPSHVLLNLDEKQYSDLSRVWGDSIAVFLECVATSVEGRQLIDLYPPKDFLSPRSSSKAKGIIDVKNAETGKSQLCSSASKADFYLASVREIQGEYVSSVLAIELKELDQPDYSAFDTATFGFDISMDGAEWETLELKVQQGSIYVVGRITLGDSAITKLEASPSELVTLSYDLMAEHPLSSAVEPTGRVNILICNDWSSVDYLLHFDEEKTRPKIFYEFFGDEDARSPIDISVSKLGVLVRSVPATYDRKPMSVHANQSFSFMSISATEHIEIHNSSEQKVLLHQEPAAGSVQSPIVAAILKLALAESEPHRENIGSIRGKFEELLSSGIGNRAWQEANFHFAFGESEALGDPLGMTAHNPLAVISSSSVGHGLDTLGFSVDPDFISSYPVNKFQDAFRELELEDAMLSRLDQSRLWPSKTSWQHLMVDRTALDNYLRCFEAMVKFAEDNFGENEVFWASYPFSISVWNFDTNLCSAVLLSPLHPLRLAWLASVEHGFWNTNLSSSLAGIVENWNIPAVGPYNQAGTSLIAVPSDLGRDQLFIGWSTMVPVHSQSQSVLGPAKIAGFVAPGSSATGLNASAAKSAISNFRNVSPQYSSLTVDLALTSGSPAPRQAELDEAIVQYVKDVARDEFDLPGGVHVLDSSLRLGNFPREGILEAKSAISPRPFSWSSYTPSASKGQKSCQLRLLQDPGVMVRMNQGLSEEMTSAASIPFRRFSHTTLSGNIPKGVSAISAGVGAVFGWTEFRDAVAQMESVASANQIHSSLSKPALLDETADWIVSGEGLLSPSSIASLLGASAAGDQLLWEWRPPFFRNQKAGEVPEISKRAYMTIARVPSSFKAGLEAKLPALPESQEPSKLVKKILTTLGSRGMGLTSLLSLGDTHTSGALGFYAAFKLLEQLEEEENLLVLPIDACNAYLERLALDRPVGGSAQRADLLAIKLSGTVATLYPIEIKMYGLGGDPYSALPEASSASLAEARAQALNTYQLLAGVKASFSEISKSESQADKSLWLSGFATLIETARKLSPKRKILNDATSAFIASLLSGQAKIELGSPMINYFVGSVQEGVSDWRVGKTIEDHEDAAVELNVLCATFSSVVDSTSNGTLHRDWSAIALSDSFGFERDTGTASDAGTETETGTGAGTETETGTGAGTETETEISKPVMATVELAKKVDKIDKPVSWFPGHKAVAPHLGLVGASGVGKTQLLKAMLGQLANSQNNEWGPPGIVIFDVKGDFSTEETSSDYDGYRDRYGFDLKQGIGLKLNYFKLEDRFVQELGHGDEEIAIFAKAQIFVGIMKSVESGVGAVQEQVLTEAIVSSYKRAKQMGTTPNLDMILQAYKRLRTKPDVVTGYLTKLNMLKILASDDQDSTPLEDVFARGKNVVINLLPIEQMSDKNLYRMVVGFLLDRCVGRMKFSDYSAQGEFEGNRQRLNQIVVVDEAQEVIPFDFDGVERLLAQGRSYGHGLILATQGTEAFINSGTNYQQLVPSWILFRVNVSASSLSKLGIESQGLNSKLASFPNFRAVFHRLDPILSKLEMDEFNTGSDV